MIESEYSEYLKGKSVALVGPSTSVNGKNYRFEIDSYDIVARVGRPLPIQDSEKQDVGTRTNIVYENLWWWQSRYKGTDYEGIIKVYMENNIILRYVRKPSERLTQFKRVNNDRVKLSVSPLSVMENASKEIQAVPTKGYLAIHDLLSQPILKLKLFGITFGQVYPYRESEGRNPLYAYPDKFAVGPTGSTKAGGHDGRREYEETYHTYKRKDKRLEVDEGFLNVRKQIDITEKGEMP